MLNKARVDLKVFPQKTTEHEFYRCFLEFQYLACMFQAIYIFATDNLNTKRSINRQTQILVHTFLQGFAILCAIVGFTAIYLNKENKKKEHFVSW